MLNWQGSEKQIDATDHGGLNNESDRNWDTLYQTAIPEAVWVNEAIMFSHLHVHFLFE
jgi:hypothetical protein